MHLDMKPTSPTGYLLSLHLQVCCHSDIHRQALLQLSAEGLCSVGDSHPHCRTDIRKCLHPSVLMLLSCSKTLSFVLASTKCVLNHRHSFATSAKEEKTFDR